MKKALIAICIFLLTANVAYATSYTSSQTGDWSSSSTWGGAGVPGAGDSATISDGTTVTVSDSRTVGSNTVGVGSAIHVHGTDATHFGTLKIGSAGNLTVRGFDIFNRMLSIDQYAHMINDSGAILNEDITSDGQSYILDQGIWNGTGLTVNGVANWNTSGSINTASRGGASYDSSRNLISIDLGNIFISNSAGTGIGSFGNTSISFGTMTPSNVFNTEVSSVAGVTAQGDYFVDYTNGAIIFYGTSVPSLTGTISYKYLVTTGSAIKAISDTDYNEFTCDHCTFNYIGSRGGDSNPAIYVDHKQTPSVGGTSRNFFVTNSTFNYVNRPLFIGSLTGTASDPILFTGNTLTWYGDNGGVSGQAISPQAANTAYINIENNNLYGHTFLWVVRSTDHVDTNTGWNIINNVFHGLEFFDGLPNISQFPGSTMKNNVMVGYGGIGERMLANFGGSLGNNATTTGNIIAFPLRAMNFVSYSDINNNVVLYAPHHGISGPVASQAGTGDSFVQNVSIENNIVADNSNHDGGAFEYGYNYHFFYDNVSVTNNTMDGGTGGHGALSFADNLDGGVLSVLSHANDYNNLISNNVTGVESRTDTSDSMGRLGLDVNDYNDVYNNTTSYVNFNRFSTFTDSHGNYNTDILKNITGVSLFNPNYTSASNKSLVLTYPSSNQPSIAWAGGSATALRAYTGTATAGANAIVNGTLTDTNQTFPTAFDNTSCPTGMWIKILSGTGAGQVRMIVNNTSTVLTVDAPWTVTPDNTSVYSIFQSTVTLADSGGTNTVQVAMDFRTLPTTAQTDTGISFAINTLTANPSFTDTSRTIMSWNVTQGGTADEYAALTRLAANPTLIGSSLLPYLQGGWLPTNTALKGSGINGLDIGAIPFLSSQTIIHLIGIIGGRLRFN